MGMVAKKVAKKQLNRPEAQTNGENRGKSTFKSALSCKLRHICAMTYSLKSGISW